MKVFLILFLTIFMISCGYPNPTTKKSNKILNFNDSLNSQQFKDLLIEYAKINPYPNIDK